MSKCVILLITIFILTGCQSQSERLQERASVCEDLGLPWEYVGFNTGVVCSTPLRIYNECITMCRRLFNESEPQSGEANECVTTCLNYFNQEQSNPNVK